MRTWLADRFVRTSGGGWIDLATDAPVVLIERTLPTDEAVAAWRRRCGRLVTLWHSHLVPLVDYALLGGGRGVEAYAEHEPLEGTPRGSSGIADAVRRYFRACGLSAGAHDASRWARCSGRLAMVPSEDTAVELTAVALEPPQPSSSMRVARVSSARSIGIRLEPPEALCGVLAAADLAGAGSGAVLVRAAPGAGGTTLLAFAARELRANGLCPVCPPALLRLAAIADHLRERRVVLLCDRHIDASSLAMAVARLAGPDNSLAAIVRVRGAHGWTPLRLTPSELAPSKRAGSGLTLRPWTPARLAAAAWTLPERSTAARGVLARRADGYPGRLVRGWLNPRAEPGRPRALGAEDDAQDRTGDAANESTATGCWGASVASGASLAAERAGSWSSATPGDESGTICGVAWRALEAGRAGEAARLFAATLDDRSRSATPIAIASTLRGLGLALIDRGQLDRGALVLRQAIGLCDVLCRDETLRAGGFETEARETRLAWIRCLLWQGRVHEAARIARCASVGDAPRAQMLRHARYRARAAWRSGDPTGTWTALADAARSAVTPDEHVAVACDRARVALACGDRDGCHRALADARRAVHIRQRMLVAAIALACLVATPERSSTDRVTCLARRLARRDVPLLVRLRVQMALEATGRPRTREVAAFVDRWGARALQDGGWAAPIGKDEAMGKDLQAVLEICRDSSDPLPALGEVCTVLRDRLGACVVAVYGAPFERGRLARSGLPRFDSPELARRTLDTGVVLRPTSAADGVEAAAPVVYAGRRIGAITCRWTVDSHVDADEAQALLLGAATALAPHVQGLNDVAATTARRTPDTLGLLGASTPIVELRDRIRRVAGAPFHVLIEGESGSGKELVARALHLAGPRSPRRFCAVNCAALTDDLFEAELFGHARGAFTGAVGERAGLFEDADGGTLFLDEVGELSLRAQAKLLRAIQDGEIRRVGESLPRRVDTRIVAATNRALADEARAGRFRADLLYRLDVVRITVPPLRDRPEDVAVLAQTCWTEAAARVGSRATLHVETLAALARYHWPGNVRELQNVVRALSVSAPSRGVVPPTRLPRAIAAAGGIAIVQTLDAARKSFEERFVRAALARAGDRPGRAARDLGLTRQGLRKLLRRLGIDDRRAVPAASGADKSRQRC